MEVKLKYWDHTCGDGCCTSSGTDVFIDGVRVSQGDNENIEIILSDVLKHLGYDVKIETEYEE